MEKTKTAQQLVQAMNNKDLKICVDEIVDFHASCVLKSGLVREFASELVNNLGDGVVPYKLKMAEEIILLEAARRFAQLGMKPAARLAKEFGF